MTTERSAKQDAVLKALKTITEAAQSWHNFHHGSDSIQCDDICAALPAAQAAIKNAEQP